MLRAIDLVSLAHDLSFRLLLKIVERLLLNHLLVVLADYFHFNFVVVFTVNFEKDLRFMD